MLIQYGAYSVKTNKTGNKPNNIPEREHITIQTKRINRQKSTNIMEATLPCKHEFQINIEEPRQYLGHILKNYIVLT